MSLKLSGTTFAQELLDNLNERRPNIFENDVFLAALFLDPRYNFELNDMDRERAIYHLIWLHQKIESKLIFFVLISLVYFLH